MNVKIYNGKLGRESWIADMEYEVAPCVGDLIEVGDNEEIAEVYEVKQRLIGLPDSLDNLALFVELYNWEN